MNMLRRGWWVSGFFLGFVLFLSDVRPACAASQSLELPSVVDLNALIQNQLANLDTLLRETNEDTRCKKAAESVKNVIQSKTSSIATNQNNLVSSIAYDTESKAKEAFNALRLSFDELVKEMTLITVPSECIETEPYKQDIIEFFKKTKDSLDWNIISNNWDQFHKNVCADINRHEGLLQDLTDLRHEIEKSSEGRRHELLMQYGVAFYEAYGSDHHVHDSLNGLTITLSVSALGMMAFVAMTEVTNPKFAPQYIENIVYKMNDEVRMLSKGVKQGVRFSSMSKVFIGSSAALLVVLAMYAGADWFCGGCINDAYMQGGFRAFNNMNCIGGDDTQSQKTPGHPWCSPEDVYDHLSDLNSDVLESLYKAINQMVDFDG